MYIYIYMLYTLHIHTHTNIKPSKTPLQRVSIKPYESMGLQAWEYEVPLSLLLLSSSLWLKVEAPDRVLSMGQCLMIVVYKMSWNL